MENEKEQRKQGSCVRESELATYKRQQLRGHARNMQYTLQYLCDFNSPTTFFCHRLIRSVFHEREKEKNSGSYILSFHLW